METIAEPIQSDENEIATKRKTRRYIVRCGWCIANDHSGCATAIRMNDGSVWRCPCDCKEDRPSRCTDCKRRGVEVTDKSTCLDPGDCRDYRAMRRAADPAFQVIDEIRAQHIGHSPRPPREPNDRVSKEGSCICCGETTRGGKFLPGHDSRYVQEQARNYLDAIDEPARTAIYDSIEKLSPALLAKWVKAMDRIKAKRVAE